jgi:acetyl-CoA carboxylase biotin carboxyl carrier protein
MTDHDPIPGLQTLMAEFARSGLMTLHVRHDEFEILLSNDPDVGAVRRDAAPRAAPSRATSRRNSETLAAHAAAAPPSGVSDLPADAIIVRAPNLGTFYRAPKPGAEDYVQIGSAVTSGQELCLIEVMKLFTAVRSDHAGRVHAVLAEDGAMVESGQPLFALVAD